jgi:hypothetical protein
LFATFGRVKRSRVILMDDQEIYTYFKRFVHNAAACTFLFKFELVLLFVPDVHKHRKWTDQTLSLIHPIRPSNL